jgi:hypothetical protein
MTTNPTTPNPRRSLCRRTMTSQPATGIGGDCQICGGPLDKFKTCPVCGKYWYYSRKFLPVFLLAVMLALNFLK